jgi:hypothetical protein
LNPVGTGFFLVGVLLIAGAVLLIT